MKWVILTPVAKGRLSGTEEPLGVDKEGKELAFIPGTETRFSVRGVDYIAVDEDNVFEL